MKIVEIVQIWLVNWQDKRISALRQLLTGHYLRLMLARRQFQDDVGGVDNDITLVGFRQSKQRICVISSRSHQ